MCVLRNAGTTLSSQKAFAGTMRNNNTDLSTMLQLQRLMDNGLSAVKHEPAPADAVNADCLTFMRGCETLQRKLREKDTHRGDLSLSADVESAPWAPSQQPGQFTSSKID